MIGKIRRLIVPYIFTAVVWVIPISKVFLRWDGKEIFERFVLCTEPSQLWFLWMLFGVFIIVWPIRNIIILKPVIGWLVSIGLFCIGIIGKKYLTNVFCIWTALQYFFLFYSGMRIRVKEEKCKLLISDNLPVVVWFSGHLLLFIVLHLIPESGVYKLVRFIVSPIVHLCGAIMVWSFFQKMLSRFDYFERGIWIKISKSSMPMYLFHQQIIYVTLYYLNGIVAPWINAIINFVVATVASLIISLILQKWRTTKTLIGQG